VGGRGPGVDGLSLGHAPVELLEAEPLRLLARVGQESAHPLGRNAAMSGASPPVMRLDGVSSVASIACSASLGVSPPTCSTML
jgi:hypothetical protein